MSDRKQSLPTAPLKIPDGPEGPLAEFSALRAEILQLFQMQWNAFALQLTVSAVLFSFSLSNPSRAGFLLILPVVTYGLSAYYVVAHYGVLRISTYIMDDLSPRVPGGLQWEAWHRKNPPVFRGLFGGLAPITMIFPGISMAAVVWVAPYAWVGKHADGYQGVLLKVAWVLCLIFTVTSFYSMRGPKFAKLSPRSVIDLFNLTHRRN